MGNTAENTQTFQLNAMARFTNLYNKIGYLKKINQGNNQRNQRDSRDRRQRDLEQDEAESDTASKPKVNYFKVIGEGLIRVLMGVRDFNVTYNENNGTIFPGFMPEAGFMGMSWSENAPGLGFVFGSQRDIRYDAVQNGWITTDPRLNNPYITRRSKDLTYRSNIEFFRDFRIEVTGSWNESFTNEEYYKADTLGIFSSFSPMQRGSYSVTYWLLKTSFEKDGPENVSPAFETFLANRQDVAFRLARENPNWSGNVVDSTGFPEGYGPSSVQVLIPSFLAAYSDKTTDQIFLNPFPRFPLCLPAFQRGMLSKLEAHL